MATFFAVPVIAYENENAIGAFQRSVEIMKQKRGQKVGATFSFGLVQLVAFSALGAIAYAIGAFVHPIASMVFGILALVLVLAIMNAAKSIFVSAVYHNVTGNPVDYFHQNLIDELFVSR